MKRIKVLYLFRRPVKKTIVESQNGNFPKDYFFGYTKLGYKFQKFVSDRVFANKCVTGLDQILIKFTYGYIKIGISPISVIFHIFDIKKSDIIFASTDSYGLPLAFFKLIGLFNKPIIINSGGLFDAINKSKSKIYKKVVKILLKKTAFVISGIEHESFSFSNLLNLDRRKFIKVDYGVDTDYFIPNNNKIGDYILAIGADLTRDWELYRKVALFFPRQKFIFVTVPGHIKKSMPINVEILYNLPIDKVRGLIRSAKFILILSKQNHRFAGQSTIFRAMSCAKAVIFTKSHGVSKLPLINYTHCIMIPPNNARIAIDNIKRLLNKKNLNLKICRNARRYVLKKNNYAVYTKKLEKLFIKSLYEEIN